MVQVMSLFSSWQLSQMALSTGMKGNKNGAYVWSCLHLALTYVLSHKTRSLLDSQDTLLFTPYVTQADHLYPVFVAACINSDRRSKGSSHSYVRQIPYLFLVWAKDIIKMFEKLV